MAPTAAVIVPTRDRPAYLDVALRSIRPQAAATGAEIVVVLDGPDAASRAVAERWDARVVEFGAPRGLNAARNAGIDATGAELLVYVDDDVAVWDGWLAALLDAHAELPADYGVLTGPIHARFEDHALRACGREGPPVTFQDFGARDVDAPHAWGANMAVRRAAFARAGRFDEALHSAGDEEEWQARLLAAGGRIRYIAAAGVDHRRAGDDARLRALCRAAYARGAASRRFDVARGIEPSLGRELRTLAGCALHVVRFRCMNGVVLSAHAAGRVRALAARGGSEAPADDFLSGESGTVAGRRGMLLRARDGWLDVREAPRRVRLRRAAAGAGTEGAADGRARRRVLVVAVERPDVPGLLPEALAELRRSRHEVVVRTTQAGDRGKFENLNALLEGEDLQAFDWLIAIDDDVALPRAFLDVFLLAAEDAGLRLAQPAHRLHSHAAWAVTRRRAGATARETTFVEIGPVTAFHRDTFATLLPFPGGLRMGWGLDAHWSALARDRGWSIGVVDATPIAHTLRPVADGYRHAEATAEARAFLEGRSYVRRDEVRTLVVHR